MSKEKVWCDWSDLYKSKKEDAAHTPTALWVNDPSIGVGPKGQASPVLKKGEVPHKPSNEEITKAILAGAPKQPTDQEMFGQFEVTEEQAQKAQEEWENRINKSLTLPNVGKSLDEDEDWGNGKSFNSSLSRDEVLRRNMHLDD